MSAVFNSDFYSDDAAAAADEHKFGDSTVRLSCTAETSKAI